MDKEEYTKAEETAKDLDLQNKSSCANHDLCTIEKCIITLQANQYCMGNFCTVCGENLGMDNPRQYCRKTYCPEQFSNYNDKN